MNSSSLSAVLLSFFLAILQVLASQIASPTLNRTIAASQVSIQLEPVLIGLSSPLYLTSARDGSNRIFIVEQTGRIKVLQPNATSPTVFLDISTRVLSGGEQGLLGLAFHPYFKNNGRLFVNYTRKADGATVVAEYHVSAANPDVADTAETVMLVIAQPFENHNGGMIDFGPDGFLYINMGDGGSGNDPGNRAQNIDELLGKILRIDVDHPSGSAPYSSPPSNPFFGSAPGRDEIFAFGLRNPFRSSFDRATGQLYVGDVGQSAREEVDRVTIGGNYGWRVMEGSICNPNFNGGVCTPPNSSILPITEYSHAAGRCSITGGYVYRGHIATLPAGVYIFGDFCTGEIFMFDGTVQSVLLDTAVNISSFGEDESGEIYVVGLGGTVDRIVNPAATCSSFINPANQSFSSSGGAGNIAVAMPIACNWTAVSNDGWISITAVDGSGMGSVSYSVMANTSATARIGTITVAGQTFTVRQGAMFSDVSSNSSFFSVIGRLSAREVTAGCSITAQGQRLYCPSTAVTREQMAIFIIRALGINPSVPSAQRFADVGPERFSYRFVEEMAARGITAGCGVNPQGQPLYCPDNFVEREQMAIFIIRALRTTTPPLPFVQRFVDVGPNRFSYPFVEDMAVRGITNGCGTDASGKAIFCPNSSVTREQMAAFLVAAFDL